MCALSAVEWPNMKCYNYLLLCLTLSNLVVHCTATACYLRLNFQPICDTFYGAPLSMHPGIRSLADCMVHCSDHPSCYSATYSSNNGSCHIYSGTLLIIPANDSNCQETVLYTTSDEVYCDDYDYGYTNVSGGGSGYVNGSENSTGNASGSGGGGGYVNGSDNSTGNASGSGGGGMSSVCFSDNDCGGVSDAECRQDRCQCVPGLSFNPPTNSCIPDCTEYGETFQEDVGYYISGYIWKTIDGSSVFSCLADCIVETLFTCRTAEFHSPSATCFLKIDTYSTQPWAYQENADYTLYQRDCAP